MNRKQKIIAIRLRKLGYSYQEICDRIEVHYWIVSKFLYDRKEIYNLNHKNQSYYENEDDYSKLPSYSFDDLSFEEKEFYFNSLKLNN